MASGCGRSKALAIDEVARSVEAAKQLRILHHFNKTFFLASAEKLLDDIISSSERALSMLNADLAYSHSPHGDDADSENTQTRPSKKRKTVTKSTKQVRVTLETGFDGTVEDGFNWRKYGQKDIQGANHPRGYYRCTHRQLGGCMATKHIQRSDEDPLLFYITYRGKHTCCPVPETQQLASVSQNNFSNTWTNTTTTTSADMSLPPFPDDKSYATSSHLTVGNNAPHFDSWTGFQTDVNGGMGYYATNSPAGMLESQVESFDSDDGSHLSFDFNGLVSFE